ncbi:MAG: bifunctional folylpolyglutamate synthase/dihydrofolate synthase [Candidatus Omnitrophota bacterium]|jgi:dihydrofolate synthase/folylpolyglutamate synthase
MNYSQSLDYLNSFLNLEKLSEYPKNSFFNLKRMGHLLRAAGRPDQNFLSVLITGTTGKGSTGFFLESILKENRIPVGYYHSPHVETVRERIRMNGALVSRALWAEGLSDIQKILAQNPLPPRLGVLTYFEIMTFLAIWLFSKTRRKVGIFEIGLGGRLDATNVLRAPVVVLTPIHLDHENFLGNTIAKIAREKAGIIKKNCFVISGGQRPEAERVIRRQVRTMGAHRIKSVPYRESKIRLEGDFQKINAGTAIQAARVLRLAFGFPINPESYPRAVENPNWSGRMERVRALRREFILDGAHNPVSVQGMVKAAAGLCCPQKTWVIFGAMQDKNSEVMLRILSQRFQKIILTKIQNPRARSVGVLLEQAKGLFKIAIPAQNIREAILRVREGSHAGSSILVTGSFYLVGEARRLLRAA